MKPVLIYFNEETGNHVVIVARAWNYTPQNTKWMGDKDIGENGQLMTLDIPDKGYVCESVYEALIMQLKLLAEQL